MVPTLPDTSVPRLPAAIPVTVTGTSGSENVSVPVVVSAVEDGVDPVTAPAPRSPGFVAVSSAASSTVALAGATSGWPFATVIVSVEGEVSPSPSVIM